VLLRRWLAASFYDDLPAILVGPHTAMAVGREHLLNIARDGPLEITADLTAGCDGRHSTVRARAGLAGDNLGAPMDVLWFRLPKNAGDPGVRWMAVRFQRPAGHSADILANSVERSVAGTPEAHLEFHRGRRADPGGHADDHARALGGPGLDPRGDRQERLTAIGGPRPHHQLASRHDQPGPRPVEAAPGVADGYLVGLAGGVTDRAKAKPDRFTVVLEESFEINGKDFSPLISKVKSAAADIFLADARPADYTLMQRQYTEAGLYHKVVSYGPRGPEKSARDALGAASDYLVAANWWDSTMSDTASKAFIDKFKAANNGNSPEWYSALGYETAVVLFKAIENAGSLDKTKVRDALAATNLTGQLVVGGTVKFKDNGQIDNAYLMTQNMPNQKVNLIFPTELATGDAVVPLPKQ